MFGSDPLLPLLPELDQLLLIRRWLQLVLARVDERITAVRTVEAEKARRQPPQEPPQWWIEYGIGARTVARSGHPNRQARHRLPGRIPHCRHPHLDPTLTKETEPSLLSLTQGAR